MRILFISLLAAMLAACATQPEKADHLALTPVDYADLPGWGRDAPASALAAFLRSCPVWAAKPSGSNVGVAGKVEAWKKACAAAQKTGSSDDAARAYFENVFRPYAARGDSGDEGLFTGYYLPELRGSLQREGAYQTPLYARPADKVDVDLGAFKTDWKGKKIVGKVQDGKLVPYDDRAAVAEGALSDRAQPLAWVDDPVAAFFLEVQGSGRVRLPDGRMLPVGYDGANGRDYVAIGRVLADRGDLPRPVTMPAIRAWLQAHPAQAQSVMNANPSYVFFRRLPSEDAIGAQGVALTPSRSMAVDPSFVPLGVPLWLDTMESHGQPLQRLMVAQDTGGAIKGAVRGDFFWGAGDNAETQAGAMQSRGRYYLLLPKEVTVHDD